MKFILISLIFIIQLFSNELSYDPDKDKFKYLGSVDNEMAANYKYFNKLLLFGDIKQAEKIAEEMYAKSRDLQYTNNLGKMISEIALSKILKENGESRKSKFLINTLLVDFKKINELDQAFLFFDLQEFDILKTLDSKEKAKFFKKLEQYTSKRSLYDFKYSDDYNLLTYLFYKYNFEKEKQSNIKKRIRFDLENFIFRAYTKNSPEFYKMLLYDAREYIDNMNGQAAISSLMVVRDNFKKLLQDNNLTINNNAFLGDIYRELGNASSLLNIEKDIEKNYKESIDIYINANLLRKTINTYSNLIYNLKYININKSFLYAKEAEEFILKYKDKSSIEFAFIKTKIADLYIETKKYENALDELYIAREIYINKFGEYSNKVKLLDLNIEFVKKTIEDVKWGI